MFVGVVFAQEGVILDKVKETTRMEYDFSFAEGLKHKMLGNPVEASRLFIKCTELFPERSASYFELGNIAFVMKDFVAAREYAEKARLIEKENEWYGLLEVQVAIADKRHLEAAEIYRSLYELNKEKKEYLSAEVDARIISKDFKTAKKRLGVLEKEIGYGAHIALRMRDILRAEGDDKRALKEIKKLVKEFPDDIEYRGIYAEFLIELGKEDDAFEEYQKIKDANSGNPIVYFSLGQYYMQKGDKEKAIKEFEVGFKSKQVNPDIKTSVFIELLRNEKTENLSAELEQLLSVLYESDMGHPGVDAMYADYIYNKGNLVGAEEIYKRVIETNPANFIAWQNLLFIQNTQLDFAEMFEYGGEASKAFPNQAIFLLFKGIGASGVENYPVAIDALKRGSRLNVGNSELTKQFYISMGDAYYKLENFKEAFINFDMLLVLEPDNVVVLNNYSYYLAVLDEKLEKALVMIEKCIKLESENSTYLDTYAWVLYKLERFDEALIAIEAAILNEKDVVTGEVFEHYGDILFENGQTEEAVKQWKKAEETGAASENISSKILQENGQKQS